MTAAVPSVRFFLADRRHPVLPGGTEWDRHLPRNRQGVTMPSASGDFTYGDYFQAVSRFLSRNDWRALRLAAGVLDPDWPAGKPFCEIDIFLEKHGAFYHPARVAATAESRRVALVVNVALSPEGIDLLASEVETIHRLGDRFSPEYLPAVFQRGTESLPDGRRLEMFLGQWFPDFHEFHLESAAPGHPPQWVVWHPDGPRFLDPLQCRALHRSAAAILTAYYDVFSGAQILDWHHAAGDFVVRLAPEKPLVMRLVTIRRHGPLLRDPPRDLAATLFHLLLFLVSTTLWLRLDRCRGVGDLILADVATVAPALEGVRDALILKTQRGELPEAMLEAVDTYLGACPRRNLTEMIRALAARRPPEDPARRLIEAAATVHADHLGALLAAGGLFGT
ncbi:MAG: hypothetical protein PHF66_03540 [Desulfobacteraceae bacterium]|nr:hypothetical protein [Desulfobacteraceae bacterium]